MDAGPAHDPPGVASVAGVVWLLDGRPTARVTARIGDRAALTDDDGRFVLGPVESGPSETGDRRPYRWLILEILLVLTTSE